MWNAAVAADVGSSVRWWGMGASSRAPAMLGAWLRLVVAIAADVVVALLRESGGPIGQAATAAQSTPDALEILTTRYARDEIGGDDDLHRKRDLSWRSPTP